MNLNDEIVNKTIAEFMGNSFNEVFNCYETKDGILLVQHYTQDLNALVPVWEKLDMPRVYEIEIRSNDKPRFNIRYYTDLAYQVGQQCETIQQAAAYATAKCIMEIEK